MKKISLVLSLVLGTLGAVAQVKTVTTYLGSPEKRADHLYASEYYQEATGLYLRALEKKPNDPRLKLQLAESYHKLNDPARAVRWYREVMLEDIITAEHKLHYAQALLSTGRVRQAEDWYAQYYEQNTTDRRVVQKLKGIEQMPRFYEDSSLYSINPTAINSTTTDFAPTFYQDGLVFVSARQSKQAIKQTYRWDETPYLATFFSPRHENGQLGAPTPFGKSLGTSYHEGPATFYDNDTQIIFTRNHSKSKTDRKLGLFAAQRRSEGDQWTTARPLPFNSTDYSVGHPTVSSDGKTLYFISDMPGGQGGTDLYVSHFENGSWQEPRNLGTPINTEGNEMFPFLHQDQTLYFASDGHRGLGGLDIYKTNPEGSFVENLGYPTNSSYDDFSLVLDEEALTGYYASNRGGQAGNDDLYQLTIHLKSLDILVVDQDTQQPLGEAEVTVIGPKALEFAMSDTTGQVHFQVNPFGSYMLDISREGYQGDALILDSGMLVDNLQSVVVPLAREIGTVDLLARLYDENTEQPIRRTLVRLVNVTTGDTISRITDDDGQVRLKVDPRNDYQFSGEIEEYAWDYPIIEGEALNVEGKNQISIPIDVPVTMTPLLVVAQDADTREPVEWATVRLIEDGSEVATFRTGGNGQGSVEIDPQKSYLISVEPLAHYDDATIVMSDELSPGTEHRLEFLLESAEGTINIEAQLYDSTSNDPLANTVVRVQNEQTGEEKTALSDEQGTVRMKVKQGESYRVLSGTDKSDVSQGALIKISANEIPDIFELKIPVREPLGYEGMLAETRASQDVAYPDNQEEAMSSEALERARFTIVNGSSPKEKNQPVWVEIDDRIYQLLPDGTEWYLKHQDQRTKLPDSGSWEANWWLTSGKETTTINNVYFGFDKYNISNTAAQELDKIVALMKAHPVLRIEASTHTDSRGPKSYNRVLSQKRAQAILAYLVKAGVDEERIYLHFYGEERLLESCNDSNCSESIHRKNRRGEFLLNFL